MTCLLSELPVAALDDFQEERRRWRTLASVPYRLRSGEILVVPKDFTTDFTSMPRLLWRIEPPTGEVMKEALAHDWLYASMLKPRAEADQVFLEEMEDAGRAWWKRSAIYRGVRLGGAMGYGRPPEHAHALYLIARDNNAKQELADNLAAFGQCAVSV